MPEPDVIVSVYYGDDGPECVLAHEEIEHAPLPKPGQKGGVHTFRIRRLPSGARHPRDAWQRGEALTAALASMNGLPGEDWDPVYNVTWEDVRRRALATGEPSLPLEKAAEVLNLTLKTLVREVYLGRVASAERSPLSAGGKKIRVFSLPDLEFYRDGKRPPWRPRKTG